MNRGDYYRYVDELSQRVSTRSDNNSQRGATASVTTVITLSRDMKRASAKDRTRGGYYLNWIWLEDIILRYYGFFPLKIGGLPTEGDGKLLLHEIG
jgi:hypothetical protein